MNKLFHTIVTMAVIFAAVSCNTLSDTFAPTKMDTEEATTKVIESIKKNINLDEWKIYRIMWAEGEAMENDLSSVNIEMINKNNSCFSQSFILGGNAAGTISELRSVTLTNTRNLIFDDIKGIIVENIDIAAIQKQYNEAKSMIPDEYEFRSISTYTIKEDLPSGNSFLDRNKNIGEIRSEFDINVIEKGKEIVESAGKKSIQYYQIDFNVNPDGSVEIED